MVATRINTLLAHKLPAPKFPLNGFFATYYKQDRYGEWDSTEAVVFAENENEAWKLIEKEFRRHPKENWRLVKVDLAEPKAHEIARDSSSWH